MDLSSQPKYLYQFIVSNFFRFDPLKTLRLFSPLLDPFLPLDRIEFIGRPEQARAYRTGSPRTYVLISRWHRRNSVYTDTGHFLASPRRSRNEREREIDTRVFSKRAFPRNGGSLSIDRTTDGFDRSCSIFSRGDVFERNLETIDFVCQFFFFFFGMKEISSIYYCDKWNIVILEILRRVKYFS